MENKYITTRIWFAWFPVRTTEGKWAWLKKVKRVKDERPEHYLGLLPEIHYEDLN
jgi:hypothetical protein